MSDLDRTPTLRRVGGTTTVALEPVHERFAGREVVLGESTRVRRLLPNLGRRLVGPWCFIDHYGPDDIAAAPGMQVPPHPHIGLQTVSWLLDGEVRHRDSIGSDELLRPGALGLMTSGAGISHAEQSPPVHPALLHGVQLWVALPEAHRHVAPAWEHHTELPVLTDSAGRATVILGELAGASSPGTTYSPAVGVDLAVNAGQTALLPLEAEFEHAVLVMSGQVRVDDDDLSPGTMLYLGCGRREVRVMSPTGARVLLLGGAPFDEEIVMWWNFVGRSTEDILTARQQWAAGAHFGTVADAGAPLPAPPAPTTRLKPGGARRR